MNLEEAKRELETYSKIKSVEISDDGYCVDIKTNMLQVEIGEEKYFQLGEVDIHLDLEDANRSTLSVDEKYIKEVQGEEPLRLLHPNIVVEPPNSTFMPNKAALLQWNLGAFQDGFKEAHYDKDLLSLVNTVLYILEHVHEEAQAYFYLWNPDFKKLDDLEVKNVQIHSAQVQVDKKEQLNKLFEEIKNPNSAVSFNNINKIEVEDDE